MINYDEVEREVKRLESDGKTTYSDLTRLSTLYTVLEHRQPFSNYSYKAGGSEFLQAMSNAPIDEALDILDEHLKTVRALYPKEYNAVLNSILRL